MTRQFCRENQGKNVHIFGKIRHCTDVAFFSQKLNFLSFKLTQDEFEVARAKNVLLPMGPSRAFTAWQTFSSTTANLLPGLHFLLFYDGQDTFMKVNYFPGHFPACRKFSVKAFGFRVWSLESEGEFWCYWSHICCPPFSAQNVNYEARKPLCWPKIPHRGIFLLSQKRPQNKGVKKNKRKANKTNHYFFLVWASILQVPNTII